MKGFLVAAATLALVAAAALAQTDQSQRQTPRPRTPDTLRVLNQRIPDVRFQDTPFEQVMEWLTDLTQLNISVRWQILQDAGVSRDTPISIQARNLRLTQVLWLVMNEAGGTETKLGYRASGNLLILSTAADLDKEMITKIYDVSDLLIRLPQASRQAAFDVTQGMGQGGAGTSGGGGGGAGGGMFGGQGMNQQNDQYGQDNTQGSQTEMQTLVDLIQQTVEPDSWRQNGGLGTIIPYQRMLVVRNTILVHQRLGGYVSEDEIAGQ